jgi:hypothetical protein
MNVHPISQTAGKTRTLSKEWRGFLPALQPTSISFDFVAAAVVCLDAVS